MAVVPLEYFTLVFILPVVTCGVAGPLEDFKCVIGNTKTNCSWIPESPHLNLTLSYSVCGESAALQKSLTECGECYSGGRRNGCYVDRDIYLEDVCMLLRTTRGSHNFRPRLVLEPPKFIVSEEGDRLRVKWMKPKHSQCEREYQLCYKECNKPQDCRLSSGSELLSYKKSCQYQFQSRITNKTDCIQLQSDFGDVVYYGSNKPPDQTFLVVAVVIPLAVSVCALLICICLRRYRGILCPMIPDPSLIFGDIIIHGTCDPKSLPGGGLYTPVLEPIHNCTIVPVAQDPDL